MDIRGPIHRNGVILKNSFIFKETLPQQALDIFSFDYQGQAFESLENFAIDG